MSKPTKAQKWQYRQFKAYTIGLKFHQYVELKIKHELQKKKGNKNAR